jgi:hypothetical protein
VWKKVVRPLANLSFASLLFGIYVGSSVCVAQDLAPRAYLITPIHSNAVTLQSSFFNGSILFNPTLPISDVSANPKILIFSYYHTLDLFGRSANIVLALPYGVGHFRGTVLGTDQSVYRSGLLDFTVRFSINLKGGPAMSPKDFRSWHQKTLIGASFTVVAPTGQYDPARLLNQGNNRWAFKPELGFSRRRGHWVIDAYGAVWFFTTNPAYFSNNQLFSGTNTLSQKPIGAFEGHLSYDVRPRLWASLDGNFWYGGNTMVNGKESPDSYQANSRVGATLSIPVTKHHALKFSYANGAYIRLGGDYQTVSVAWQYSWLGRPK